MKNKEWTLDDSIKEIRELSEYDAKIEEVKKRVEQHNQLKNRINMLSEFGAKLALRILLNELNNVDKTLIYAIEMGEEI